MKFFFTFILSLPLLSVGYSQQTEEIESEINVLKAEILNAKHDSDIVNSYIDWDNLIYRSDPKLDLEINQKIEVLCEQRLKKEANPSENIFFKKALANASNNLGLCYVGYGDYVRALDYHSNALLIEEELNDKKGQSQSLNNIGNIYGDMGGNKKALKYYERSMALSLELGDEEGSTGAITNIGNVYSILGDKEKAMEFYLKGLEIDRKYNYTEGIGISLGNIGDVYLDDSKYELALNYFYQALEEHKKIDNIDGISSITISICEVLYEQGKYSKTIELSLSNLIRAEQTGGILDIADISFMLYQCYQKTGNFENALKMHKQHTLLEDSIGNENNKKEIVRHELKSSYKQQKALDDAKNDKLLAIEQEKKEKQTILTIASASGLILVAIFLLFVFNRLRITKKQKLIIEEQKLIVDEKNKEITDSINYAKRIQNAILPPAKIVKQYLQDSFILYKPKDIVAGDFYWLEHKNNQVLFAAADCTGHGVPGAMVSVVCNNALNRSVREYNLNVPGEILDKTRDIVINEFEESDEDVKDGMDIALCSLDGNKLQYAGANNPLWIIRDSEVLETKSNKQPIGIFDNPLPYTTHSFDLIKGDTVYIFSDGYVDQFGGEKGKKFKAKTFKDLLLSIQEKSMEEQKLIIDNTFESWRGDLEQIDDVCVIGVRV